MRCRYAIPVLRSVKEAALPKRHSEPPSAAMLDRKSLEEAIAQSTEGVVITDFEGVICYLNPACARLTGYRPEEVIGKKPSLFRSGVQDETFYRDLWDTIRAGKVWSGELSPTAARTGLTISRR
jgi:PAS domain-containing protein